MVNKKHLMGQMFFTSIRCNSPGSNKTPTLTLSLEGRGSG